ncbi:MAG: hypothetical protein ACOYKN_14530 [Pirellula sp.]
MADVFPTLHGLNRRLFRPLGIALGIASLVGLPGCQRESSSTAKNEVSKTQAAGESGTSQALATNSNPANSPTAEPDPSSVDRVRSLLADCLKTYRSLERYQDRGQLVIQGVSTLTLPMQVAWERPNRLGLRTGSLQGIWTSTTWEAQSLGAINPFPNQRLVRPLPPRIDLDWIADNTMGGLLLDPMSKPLQLELLLSSDLSENLAGTDSVPALLEPMVFDEVQCQRVAIEKTLQGQTLRWVLWIDPKSKLLRKIELPARFYYPNAPNDQLVGISCAMELLGARAEDPIDWSTWSLPSDAQELHVARWTPPPPIASSPILGKVIEPIDFKDANDSILLDTAEPKKPWNVLVWISDQIDSRLLVDDLMNVRRVLLEKELTPSCNIILVANAEDQKRLIDNLKAWNCDLPLAVDRDGSLSRAFQISQAPAMILLDRSRRVQVAEYVVQPNFIASIPELVSKLRGQQDLASRQLQQDLDNQSRFIGALHRVAIDKEQTAKIPEIIAFPFLIHGMRRDWKIELEAPLVSAAGAWYPQASLNATGEYSPSDIAMATLDEDGRLQSIAFDGTKKLCAKIEPEQADGAKRLVTSIDPWTRRWIAVVPEGLPRFWIASASGSSVTPGLATAYNTQAAESPVCHAWIPHQSADSKPLESKLAIGTSESRLMMIEPTSEQRLDGTFREPPVAFVPGLTSEGLVAEWDVLYSDGTLHKISNLTRAGDVLAPGATLEARLDRLGVRAVSGNWLWGNHGSAAGRCVELFLGKLPSGETGTIVANHLHQPLVDRALTVRPEQARLLGATRLKDGSLMGVASGPNRILHLFSADLRLMDQASFSSRILGACVIGSQADLKLVVALEREVSCWTIDVPDTLPVNSPR